MKKKLLSVMVVSLALALMIGSVHAEVINFDDLSTNHAVSGTNYAGLTWGGSSVDSFPGETGYWVTRGVDYPSYAIPHSGSNYLVNAWGPNNLWFAFSSPATFDGAWFAYATGAGSGAADKVRFKDDNTGTYSDWLTLNATPQFLSANFTNSTKIYVEREGGSTGVWEKARWYTMDDVKYTPSAVPIPPSVWLLGSGLLGLVGLRRRFASYLKR